MSNINANNIDGTYPVAGQDNDSQGFRTNFTNIKNNFTYAKSEIEDIQAKAVLKSGLTGETLDNNMAGSVFRGAEIRDLRETRSALGTTSGTLSLDHANGHYYTITTSGSVTLSFTGFPSSGRVGRIKLEINVASTSHTMTLPAAVTKGIKGIGGLNQSTLVLTFGNTGTHIFEFTTQDGGSSIHIEDLSRPRNYIFSGEVETIATTGATSLQTSVTSYTIGGAITSTLAAGLYAGQTKMLVCGTFTSGSMTVTVTNPGWSSSGTGTITFNTVGDSATLVYVGSKWHIIGSNSVTFA